MASGQTPWLTHELTAAKSFFDTNPNADQMFNKAQEYGMNNEQFADLFSQSTGKNYNDALGAINSYTNATGKQLTGGYMSQAQKGALQASQSPNPVATGSGMLGTQPSGNWTQEQLNAGKQFFGSNPTPDQIYEKAQSLGLGANQLADIYAQSTGADYGNSLNLINSYVSQTGKSPLVSGAQQPGSTTGQTPQPTQQPGQASTNSIMSNGQWNVTPDQTVQGQLKGLLADNNPLVQIAKTQGLENAQERGLLNSSLGAEAGALAHYQYAMPIATQDATTYGNAARTNAENAVQVGMQQAGFDNQKQMADINFAHDSALSKQQAQQSLDQLNKQNANTINQLDESQRNTLQNTYLAQMNQLQLMMSQQTQQIQASDIPAESKTEQIAQMQATMNNLISWSAAAYGNMPNWTKSFSLLPATIS